jgi:glyoxylase-like metal-dependent hydrolase (beta-lactamase superfamily II)
MDLWNYHWITVLADVEIWCHKEELKNAFWAYGTSIECGPYVKEYLTVDQLNWKTFSSHTSDIYQCITLHHGPGHTSGSIAMELALEQTGSVIITGDAFHVKEKYEQGIPPRTLTRDWHAWHRSRNYIRTLAQRKQAKVVLGHEPEYFRGLKISPGYSE